VHQKCGAGSSLILHSHLAPQNGRPRRAAATAAAAAAAATGTAAAAEAANLKRKTCNQHAPGAVPTRDGHRHKEGFAAASHGQGAASHGLAAASHGLGATLVEKRYAFTSFSLKHAPPSLLSMLEQTCMSSDYLANNQAPQLVHDCRRRGATLHVVDT